jgi:anti-anti-sigma factor
MLIQFDEQGDVFIMRFQGRIATGDDLEYLTDKLDQVRKRRSEKVLADFRDVISIGSTGIGFVVGVYTSVIKLPNGRFVLIGANPRVREVLDLTRLSSIIPLANDLSSGLAMLQTPTVGNDAAAPGL